MAISFRDMLKRDKKPNEVTVAQANAFTRALVAPDRELSRIEWTFQVAQAMMELPSGGDSYIAAMTAIEYADEGAYLRYLSGEYGNQIFVPDVKEEK